MNKLNIDTTGTYCVVYLLFIVQHRYDPRLGNLRGSTPNLSKSRILQNCFNVGFYELSTAETPLKLVSATYVLYQHGVSREKSKLIR